jgi:hypothetical protein
VTQRDRIVLAVIATAGILAAFWFGALAPKRKDAKALDTQIAQQETRRDEAMARVAAGEQARKRFAADYAEVARLGKAVPVGDQVPSLVYELQSAAAKNTIDFRAVKLRAGATSAPAAPAATTTAGTGGVSATQAAAAVAPPGSQVGTAGFPTLPFTFKFDGDFFKMERLLSAIERFTSTLSSGDQVKVNGRLVTVDGFSIGASKQGGFPNIQAAITATAYVLPPGEDAFAGATPAGPATAGTPAAAAPAGQQPGTAAPAGAGAPTTAAIGGVTP